MEEHKGHKTGKQETIPIKRKTQIVNKLKYMAGKANSKIIEIDRFYSSDLICSNKYIARRRKNNRIKERKYIDGYIIY